MSNLTKRGWSAADYAEYKARSKGPHSLQWKANSYRSLTGTENLLYDNLPITGGTLTLDSSNLTRRTLEIEIGGGEGLETRNTDDPLAPFGQYLKLWWRIDRADGTWFPYVLAGWFPITSYSFERPSHVATIEANDLSARIEEYLLLGARHFKDVSVYHAIMTLCQEALPNRVIGADDVDAEDRAKSAMIANFVADAGTGRWTAATDIADRKGFEIFWDADSNLVIRNMIGPEYDEVIMGHGPDIGTVSHPVLVLNDGTNGNLVGLTSTVTREGGCNHVRLNLTGTRTKRDKKQNPKHPGVETHQSAEHTYHVDAPASADQSRIQFGGSFGYLPIVEDRNLEKIEAGEIHDKQLEANRIYARRRGLVRSIDCDIVGGYHLEPDDRVSLQYAGRTEAHYIGSVEFDLTGQSATRIRTRAIAVLDPG